MPLFTQFVHADSIAENPYRQLSVADFERMVSLAEQRAR